MNSSLDVAKTCHKVLTRLERGFHFAVVYEGTAPGYTKYHFPQLKIHQPCWGELAYYTDVHGKEAGGPNTYRPSDLFTPMICAPGVRPVHVLWRTKFAEATWAYLKSKDNAWAAGFDNVSRFNDNVLMTGTNINATVFANFLWQTSYWSWDFEDSTRFVKDRMVSTYVEYQRFREKDPILYLNDKKYSEGGNYYRGGMTSIWNDEPHQALKAG